MRLTPTQLIPYPDPEDHGAGGRHLQDIAERLETVMNAVDLGYLARRNPPSWIVRRTSNQSIPTGTDTVIWQSVDFDNTGNRAPTLSGSTTTGKLGVEGRPETWWVGTYIKMGSASTPGTFRQITLVVSWFDPLTGASAVQRFPIVAEQEGAGGEHLQVDATVRTFGNATVYVETQVVASSAPTAQSPSLLWATRISQE